MSRRVGSIVATLASVGFLSITSSAPAATPAQNSLSRMFNLPAPNAASGGSVLFDALPDGRLVALNGAQVSVETAARSGTFSVLGSVPGFSPTFGPSFFTVSPDGTKAAAGSNGGGSVVVFNVSNPTSVTSYAADDYDAQWIDNSRLAITNSASSGVQVLNTANASLKTIVTGLGGASSGIALDASGNLYTGNGYDLAPGGSDTGWIKAFSSSAWNAALTSGTPINFESSGTPVADLLSAASLGFDNSGNFFVGGADFFGVSNDLGYAGLIASDAITAALAAGASTPPISAASPASELRKFISPADTITNQQPPFWNYNNATGELYLSYFQQGAVGVYAVPEPGSLSLLCGAALLTLRRRRHAKTAAGLTAAAATLVTSSAFAGIYSGPSGVTSGAPDNPIARSSLKTFESSVVSYNPAPGVRSPTFTNYNTSVASLGDLYSPLPTPTGAANTPYDKRYVPANGTEPNAFHMGSGAANNYSFNGNVNDTTDTYGFIGIDAPGSITLGFSKGIRNGTGPDLAVFENGFVYPSGNSLFAELAFVEVSTDGTNFARFPSVSLNTAATAVAGTFQGYDVTNMYNLAGKHASNWGTPFDLNELSTSSLVTSGQLDLNDIRFVRLVDVVGSGTLTNGTTSVTGAVDSLGNPILDKLGDLRLRRVRLRRTDDRCRRRHQRRARAGHARMRPRPGSDRPAPTPS